MVCVSRSAQPALFIGAGKRGGSPLSSSALPTVRQGKRRIAGHIGRLVRFRDKALVVPLWRDGQGRLLASHVDADLYRNEDHHEDGPDNW